jgi:hypothetical protein
LGTLLRSWLHAAVSLLREVICGDVELDGLFAGEVVFAAAGLLYTLKVAATTSSKRAIAFKS